MAWEERMCIIKRNGENELEQKLLTPTSWHNTIKKMFLLFALFSTPQIWAEFSSKRKNEKNVLYDTRGNSPAIATETLLKRNITRLHNFIICITSLFWALVAIDEVDDPATAEKFWILSFFIICGGGCQNIFRQLSSNSYHNLLSV